MDLLASARPVAPAARVLSGLAHAPRLASPPREHLAAAIEAAAEAVSHDDLGQGALRAAVGVVGASNVLLYRYDDRGVVHGVAGTLAAAIPSYARELFEEDPVQHHFPGWLYRRR